jgi:predicted nuclease with TOPRIM domain
MENTTTSNKEKQYTPYSEPKKRVPMFLVAIVVTLVVLSIVLAIKLYINTSQRNAVKEDLSYVETEKKKLEVELNGLITEYDSLKTENDTLNTQLQAEQDRIKKLLSIQASNVTKIKMYQSELETLRKVMRSYIVQIDSLNTKNRELTETNIQTQQELNKVSTNYEQLSKKSEELSSIVKIAQKLNAENITAEGVNKKSKPKDRISKIEKIKVCFKILENAVALAGTKTIYLRISRPDDVILSSPEAGMFDFEGQSLAYSAKRDLDYENKDIDICIYWDKTEELIPGTYIINLYAEGYDIGTATFILK